MLLEERRLDGRAGAVAWQFERKGVVEVGRRRSTRTTLMEIVADAGAEDLETDPDGFGVTTAPATSAAVRAALEASGVTVKNAELDDVADDDDRGRRRGRGEARCCG